MRRFLSALAVLVVGFLFSLGLQAYHRYGRTVVYANDNKTSKYGGYGPHIIKRGERILVNPIADGSPFFDESWMEFKYPHSDYVITKIPAQDELQYVVGRVLGWEDIESSSDKYLVVQTSSDYKNVEKWRVIFSNDVTSSENHNSDTLLAVEDTQFHFRKTVNSIQKCSIVDVSDITSEKLQQLILKDDSVVLNPTPDYPSSYSEKDASGNYVALWITVRRVGGVNTFEHEMQRIQ